MHIDLFLLLLLLVRIGGQIDCVASTGDAARTSMSLARHTSVLSGRPPHLDSKRCQAAPLCLCRPRKRVNSLSGRRPFPPSVAGLKRPKEQRRSSDGRGRGRGHQLQVHFQHQKDVSKRAMRGGRGAASSASTAAKRDHLGRCEAILTSK